MLAEIVLIGDSYLFGLFHYLKLLLSTPNMFANSCAVYVSSSIFEGFDIPLVEAMATGTVPVVSDIEAHRFVFQCDNVGYLVASAEEMTIKISDLLDNETGRLRLATNGRRLVEQKWTRAKVAERYRELIGDSLYPITLADDL